MSMKKSMSVAVLFMLMVALSVGSVYGVSQDRIVVNGAEKMLQKPITLVESHVMIQFKALAEATGMEITWNSSTASITCLLAGEEYIFRPMDTGVIHGWETRKMSSPLVIIDGNSYVPLNAVSDVFEGSLKLAGNYYEITIAQGGDKPFGQYSYDDLLQLAIKNSVSLTKAETNLEQAKIINKEVTEDYIEMPGSSGVLESARMQTLLGVEGSEISLKTADIAVASTKDSIDYQLTSLINQVISAERASELSEEELNLARIGYAQSSLKYEQGLLSRIEFDQSKETLSGKELAVKINLSKRDALIVKLDSMLKLGADKYDFIKTATPIYSVLADRDLEAHVKDVLAYSPDLWSLEQAIKLNESKVTYYVFNAGLDPYDAKELDVKKAKLDLQSARESTDSALRGLYEQILQLEDTMKTLDTELRKAQGTLTLANANYKAGLITELALKQAIYAVNAIEYQQINAKASYEIMKNGYLKPWAAD